MLPQGFANLRAASQYHAIAGQGVVIAYRYRRRSSWDRTQGLAMDQPKYNAVLNGEHGVVTDRSKTYDATARYRMIIGSVDCQIFLPRNGRSCQG